MTNDQSSLEQFDLLPLSRELDADVQHDLESRTLPRDHESYSIKIRYLMSLCGLTSESVLISFAIQYTMKKWYVMKVCIHLVGHVLYVE
jgi:hypothetical protein